MSRESSSAPSSAQRTPAKAAIDAIALAIRANSAAPSRGGGGAAVDLRPPSLCPAASEELLDLNPPLPMVADVISPDLYSTDVRGEHEHQQPPGPQPSSEVAAADVVNAPPRVVPMNRANFAHQTTPTPTPTPAALASTPGTQPTTDTSPHPKRATASLMQRLKKGGQTMVTVSREKVAAAGQQVDTARRSLLVRPLCAAAIVAERYHMLPLSVSSLAAGSRDGPEETPVVFDKNKRHRKGDPPVVPGNPRHSDEHLQGVPESPEAVLRHPQWVIDLIMADPANAVIARRLSGYVLWRAIPGLSSDCVVRLCLLLVPGGSDAAVEARAARNDIERLDVFVKVQHSQQTSLLVRSRQCAFNDDRELAFHREMRRRNQAGAWAVKPAEGPKGPLQRRVANFVLPSRAWFRTRAGKLARQHEPDPEEEHQKEPPSSTGSTPAAKYTTEWQGLEVPLAVPRALVIRSNMWVGKQLLILDNVALSEYGQVSEWAGATGPQMRVLVTRMGRFHAANWRPGPLVAPFLHDRSGCEFLRIARDFAPHHPSRYYRPLAAAVSSLITRYAYRYADGAGSYDACLERVPAWRRLKAVVMDKAVQGQPDTDRLVAAWRSKRLPVAVCHGDMRPSHCLFHRSFLDGCGNSGPLRPSDTHRGVVLHAPSAAIHRSNRARNAATRPAQSASPGLKGVPAATAAAANSASSPLRRAHTDDVARDAATATGGDGSDATMMGSPMRSRTLDPDDLRTEDSGELRILTQDIEHALSDGASTPPLSTTASRRCFTPPPMFTSTAAAAPSSRARTPTSLPALRRNESFRSATQSPRRVAFPRPELQASFGDFGRWSPSGESDSLASVDDDDGDGAAQASPHTKRRRKKRETGLASPASPLSAEPVQGALKRAVATSDGGGGHELSPKPRRKTSFVAQATPAARSPEGDHRGAAEDCGKPRLPPRRAARQPNPADQDLPPITATQSFVARAGGPSLAAQERRRLAGEGAYYDGLPDDTLVATDWSEISIAPFLWDFAYSTVVSMPVRARRALQLGPLLDVYLRELTANCLLPVSELPERDMCVRWVKALNVAVLLRVWALEMGGLMTAPGLKHEHTAEDRNANERWTRVVEAALDATAKVQEAADFLECDPALLRTLRTEIRLFGAK